MTISEDRLRNVRAWAAARPDMSGGEVIVGAIDELLHCRSKLAWRTALLGDTRKLLREMRDDIFQRGTLSGRSQHAGADLLQRIDTCLPDEKQPLP